MKGARTIVFNKKGEVLLVKRRDVPYWEFPGGKMDQGETLTKTATREAFEESGYTVAVTREIGVYHQKYIGFDTHLFEAKLVSGKPATSRETTAVGWYPVNALPSPLQPETVLWINDTQLRAAKPVKREISTIHMGFVVSQLIKRPMLVLRYLLMKIGVHVNL